MSSLNKQEKKEKKLKKAAEKAAKQNPFGKNSKYSGGVKNVSKYSKEGREKMKLQKSANPGLKYRRVYPKKSKSVSDTLKIIPKPNPKNTFPKKERVRLESQKKIRKRERKIRKEIRQVVNPMIDQIFKNVIANIK